MAGKILLIRSSMPELYHYIRTMGSRDLSGHFVKQKASPRLAVDSIRFVTAAGSRLDSEAEESDCRAGRASYLEKLFECVQRMYPVSFR
jgi:hypothetical protein